MEKKRSPGTGGSTGAWGPTAGVKSSSPTRRYRGNGTFPKSHGPPNNHPSFECETAPEAASKRFVDYALRATKNPCQSAGLSRGLGMTFITQLWQPDGEQNPQRCLARAQCAARTPHKRVPNRLRSLTRTSPGRMRKSMSRLRGFLSQAASRINYEGDLFRLGCV